MHEKKGFSFNGYGVFAILLAAAAFVVSQATANNIKW